MIKKIAAYSFILLANITLLVHVVIPHHHHQEAVCIVNSHCDADTEKHQHSNDDHHHDHNGNSDAEFCVLSQITAIYNQVKHDNNCTFCTDHQTLFTDVINTNIGLDGPSPKSLTKIPLLFFSSDYPSFSGASFSLRGPPIV